MNKHPNAKFNDTMTDIALALISLHAAKGRVEDQDIFELLEDIEKSIAELTDEERADLAPQIRSLVERLRY